MNKNLKIVLFGFLVWLVPFLVSFVVFPLKDSNRALFESIMPLVLTVVVTTLAYYYLKDINLEYLKNGLIIGVVWYIVSIVIDLCLFMPASPMHMSFGDYMMDIGLTYFIIPVITVGMALIAQNKAAE
jgi:hypothetical protein